MKSIRKLLTAGAVALLLVSASPATTAVADPTPAPDKKTQSGPNPRPMAPDGNFYAFEHVDLGGRWCAWETDDRDWRFNAWTNCPWFSDIASSAWNNGYAGLWDDVMVCVDVDFGSPCIEIRNAEVARNLHAWGWGDIISSHYWK